ncbi:hypothetical protein Tco_0285840, partial [Tanacetum coccineum]
MRESSQKREREPTMELMGSWSCKELLQKVDRLVEENNSEELSVTDMTELEQELDAALVQTRLRK